MSEPPMRSIGEILVERGLITAEQLEEAVRLGAQRRRRLGEVLLETGVLSSDQLNWALAESLGIPYVDLREEMVDLELARTLPEEVLRRHEAFPVLRAEDELTVILADPTNAAAIVELQALTGAKVTTAIAPRETITRLLNKVFPPSASPSRRVRYAELGAAQMERDPSGVAHAYAFLLGALREEATEIHIEPLGQEVRVRYRIEGRLVERTRMPRGALGPVVSRFRVLAGLIGDGLPRQASVRTQLERQEVELELLFFPTLCGDAVTVKIWRRALEAPTVEALEMEPTARETVARLTGAAGLVFVTGWDPWARAALLYALARAATLPTRKVLTLERAVSYVVPEFVQVELPDDFDQGAATILADPADVALVEDLSARGACLAAIAGVERGALVVGGLACGTNATGLAQLLSLNVPRGSLLAVTTALVNVRRQGARHRIDVLSLTEKIRQELLSRYEPWTSRNS